MDRIEILASVTSAMPMPAVIIGRSKRVLTMNEPARQVLGHDASGSHYTAILRQPQVTDAIESTLADQTGRQENLSLRDGGSDELWRLDIAPLSGEPSAGILIVFEDLSSAEGLGQMRRDFVANVSHELRTPLTALTGFIETLQGPASEDKAAAQRFLAMMDTEAQRMNRLVQDLLSLSRVESEERVRPDERVDLAEIVREAAQTLSRMFEQANTELQLKLPDGPVWINGDRDQITQVLHNLLENAVKYGAGAVTVSMTLPEREAALRGPAVLLDIRDNGEGIEAHHLPRLTERFYRIDAHRSRSQGGTGLGLAIVKHVVSRHRGRFRVSSVPGEGSVFTVVLPRLPDAAT
ncbi:MAG: ATP-binding protein [Pseudomonadota bacterium]